MIIAIYFLLLTIAGFFIFIYVVNKTRYPQFRIVERPKLTEPFRIEIKKVIFGKWCFDKSSKSLEDAINYISQEMAELKPKIISFKEIKRRQKLKVFE